jgi:hypothetical protein
MTAERRSFSIVSAKARAKRAESALASDLTKCAVCFWEGLFVFDGDFYNEFSATDMLLGPGDPCSHVIVIERHQFDVHTFCHSSSPLISGAMPRFQAQMLLV